MTLGTSSRASPFAFAGSPDEANAQRLAEELVHQGVARDVAVAWAVRTRRGWEQGAGRASAEGSLELEPIFDLASVTKPMTATAFACSPRIARDARLGDVLDEAHGTASERCSLELLLAHRGGLEAHQPLYRGVSRPGSLDRVAANRRVADARRADARGPIPPEGFPPVYSDLGFALVGDALARAEGAIDAGDVVERRVVRSLGRDDLGTARLLRSRSTVDFMRRVRPTEVCALRGGEVRGIVHDENAWALTGEGGSGHAGMFGTAPAVLAFGCAVSDAMERRIGPLVVDAWRPRAEARTDGSSCESGVSSARAPSLEWLVRPRPGGSLRAGFDGKSESGSSAGTRCGPRTFGHLGFTGTSLWIDPDAGVVVVVLTNRVYPTRENVAIRAARPVVHDALFAMAIAHGRSIG